MERLLVADQRRIIAISLLAPIEGTNVWLLLPATHPNRQSYASITTKDKHILDGNDMYIQIAAL